MTKKAKYSNCDEVYKKLKNYFLERLFEAGDRVPSEREIAENLCANRTTLRTAMKRMVKEDILERHVGIGTFFKVSAKCFSNNYDEINNYSFKELLEMRLLLEPQITSKAIENLNEENISQIYDDFIGRDNSEMQQIEYFDISFNKTIVEFCHNNMLQNMYSSLVNIRTTMMENNDKFHLEFWEPEEWKVYQRKILGGIESGNPESTEKAVVEKLLSLRKNL